MATLARNNDDTTGRARDLEAGPMPVTRRQSAEAVALLLGVLVVLLGVALAVGTPVGIGQ